MLTTSFPRHQGDRAGRFVFDLAKELSRQHHIAIVAPGAEGLHSHETIGRLEVFRFHYCYPHEYEKIAYGRGILNNLDQRPRYRALIPIFALAFLMKSIKVGKQSDLIHAHWVFSGLIGLLGRRIHKKPVVLTVRGSDINVQYAGARTSRPAFRWVLQRSDYITTVSNDLLKMITDEFGVVRRIACVPNGVSLETFSPMDRFEARRMLGLPRKIPIILYAGRIIESKGIRCLVEVIPTVLKAYEDALFVFLGEGNLVERLVRTCKDMGIEQSVLFSHERPHAEMPFWLNAADLVVLPSLSEGRPNTVIEGMACATPIVATRVGGIPELVKDGENGYLVPPNDQSYQRDEV